MKTDKKHLNSPCIRVCCLNENDICLGCFRSLDEIKCWAQVDEQTRQHFLNNCQQRRAEHDSHPHYLIPQGHSS